jgi:hypothetical protein
VAAEPFAVHEVGADELDPMRVRSEPLDRLAVQALGGPLSLSSARERASMPGAQSLPLARVWRESRRRASAAGSGLPLRSAASISSTSPKVEYSSSTRVRTCVLGGGGVVEEGIIDGSSSVKIGLRCCTDDTDTRTIGMPRAIIASLGLAGPRVGDSCGLDNKDVVLAKARFHIDDAKTEAGIRTVDMHPRLLEELTSNYAGRPRAAVDAPAFPTRVGTRRDRDNVLKRVVTPALARANELRASRDEPPVRVHLTPHTFRRTYVTFMVAAGCDLPYIQARVGHVDPTTTLRIYAQMITRSDRDQLRAEIRELLGIADSKRAQGELRRSRRSVVRSPRKCRSKGPKRIEAKFVTCSCASSAQRKSPICRAFSDGARGTRTPDLLGAIQALSQLSYSPGRRRWAARSAQV